MSLESKQMWWNKSYTYFFIVALILLTSLFIRFLDISEKWVVSICLLLGVLIFALSTYFFKKVLGRDVFNLSLLCFIVCLIQMFNGAFLSYQERFLVNTLIYYFAGAIMLYRRKGMYSFTTIFLLLFAPSFVIFIPFTANFGDKLFAPISYSPLISLIFLYLFQRSKSKVFISFISILVFAITSYIIYPSYWSYFQGKVFDIKAQIDEKNDHLVINENGTISSINELNHKIVILDVWYSGCGACFKKFPEFDAFTKDYIQDTSLFFASLNIPLEKELDTFNSFDLIKEYSFNKLQATSTTDENKWNVEFYPTILIFDKNHKLRYKGALNTNRMLLVNNIHKIIDELKKE